MGDSFDAFKRDVEYSRRSGIRKECFHLPPKYIQTCLAITFLFLFLGIFSAAFFLIFLFCFVMTFLNSIWGFRDEKKYNKRGLLRYFNGWLPSEE